MENPHLKNPEDTQILVCTRVGEIRMLYGSIHATCSECNSPIVVSESGQKAIRDRKNLKAFCMQCAKIKMETDEEIKAEIVPGAIDELRRYFMKIGNN